MGIEDLTPQELQQLRDIAECPTCQGIRAAVELAQDGSSGQLAGLLEWQAHKDESHPTMAAYYRRSFPLKGQAGDWPL